MALAISLLALLATFYQLYLQRVHNEKSLKPLVQIDLIDRNYLIGVHVQNNGVGPFIIEKLTFFKDGRSYTDIEGCLELDPKSYQHIRITDVSSKVILPGTHLEVFSTGFSERDTERDKYHVQQQLSALTLKAEGRDIYNNKVTTDRDLCWFGRHSL